MSNLKTVGVVGYGFVGSAVAKGFNLFAEIRVYDIDPRKATHEFEEVVNSDFVFVCLPTPMSSAEGGECDLSIMEGFFEKANTSVCKNPQCIFVIKSTVPIGTTEKLSKKYCNIAIVHNPEFLTARSALVDFITPARQIIGGRDPVTVGVVKTFLEGRFPGTPCYAMTSDESEMVKYMANTFFATKVIFFNEMRLLTQVLGISWERILEGVLADGRIGKSHYQVPGHDGEKGYGGTCFPKDVNALISLMEEKGLDPKLLKAGWEQNLAIRKNRDWASNKSAVSDKSQLN
jgi:nucleotide sugar dehydrogenase